MTTMLLTGGCMCRAVRYEIEALPFDETICHCGDCRRAVGAHAVAWFSVPRSALRFLGGAPIRYRSSVAVVRGFCGRCGTSLTYERDRHLDEIDVTTASLDAPEHAAPKNHTQTGGKLSWDLICDGLPAFRETRSGGPQ